MSSKKLVNPNIAIPNIVIKVVSHFVPQQSDEVSSRFVFSYTVTIENHSDTAFQLLSRHWVIQDGNMKVEEVYGDGVVGEQPIIQAGDQYEYSSGAVLETDIGTMEGRYFFIDKGAAIDSGSAESDKIEIPIPKFLLTVPRTVH